MKKILLLILVTCACSTFVAAQKPTNAKAAAVPFCCPDFTLAQDYEPHCRGNCKSDAGIPNGGSNAMMVSCRSTHLYYVVPNLIGSGFSYTWTITGGSPATASGNPVSITWGPGVTAAQIKVVISGPGGCNKTIIQDICLVDGPVANIAVATPNPVCVGTPVNFSASPTAALSYSWDFGDNTYGTGQNVSHAYGGTGVFYAILTVKGDTAQGGCGCIDRDTVQINVNSGSGLQINPVSCKKMFCPGDTATFCAVNCAGPYTWTIVGGTPATATGNCVTITWNANSPVPASVTVTSASCPGSCGNTATLQVPVLYPNLQINGTNLPDKVCPGSTTSYSLPSMPGVFYKWNVVGGGSIVGPDSNVNVISVFWPAFPVPAGPYQVICNYHNPITGCKGADTITVFVRPPFTITGPSQSCVGSPFSYFNNSATPGPALWTITPANVFTPLGATPSISGTWAATGTYLISATPSLPNNYCTNSASVVTVVNPVPVITAINTISAVCKNSTHIYSVVSSMPGVGSYTWNITGGLGTNMGAHNDSIQVDWDNSGVYSISVTQTVAGCTSAPFNVPVPMVANPTIAPNPGPFCMDASSTFTASPVLGPGNYTWTINNNLGSLMSPQGGNTMNVQWNGGITPGVSVAIITVTNSCGAFFNTSVNVITPNAISIVQSGDLCNPTGVQLTATAGFTGYTWTGPAVSGPSGNTANALAAGLYTVTAVDANGCAVKATTYVLPKNLPPVTISSASRLVYCPNDTVNVTMSASFSSSYVGCSYQWYQNGNIIPGQTTATLNIPPVALQNTPGSNTFYVIVKCGGCSVISNIITVTVLATCPSGPGPCPYGNGAKVANPNGGNNAMRVITGLGDVTITGPANNSTLCTGTGNFTSTYNLYQNTFSIAAAWWDFGDGTASSGTQTGSGMGPYNNTTTHTYTNCGNYLVVMHVIVQCSPTTFCTMTDTIRVNVPIVARFIPTVVCNKVYLQDQSSSCQPACNFTYAWTATGPGTVSFAPSATGLYSSMSNTTIMTASASGTYVITLTLSSASCGCTGPNAAVYTQTVNINLPSAAFVVPPAVCAGTPVSFTASGATSYNWNFYSMYQSNLQTTVHSFPMPPGTRPVTLTVTDAMGCTASLTQNVTVLAPITVAIVGAADICPGGSVTLTTSPPVFQTYQWYHDGVPAGTGPNLVVTTAGQYWVEVTSNSGGCSAKSPKVTIKYKHAPVADIKPVKRICLGSGGSLILENSMVEVNTNYNWTLYSGPTTVSFSPNGTNAAWQTTATPASPAAGDYIIILTATDVATGCITSDTICIKVYNPPTFTVSGSGGCAGVNHTFVAAPAATYNYTWSNGVTGNTMTTSLAGTYYVTASDPISGCTTTLFAGVINPQPDVSLFPRSECDTLCDTVKLVPPLALAPFQNYGIYTIKWYDGVTLIYTGPFLALNTLVPNPGQHNIHIVVTNAFGCSATSGNYNVYVHPCGDCDCKGSKWGDILLGEGEVQHDDPKANVIIPKPKKLECKQGYELICNKTYNISAAYNCKDTACKGKVTYSLQPPTGLPITGTLPPLNFTPTMSGTYTLTLYGWCGDKKCDSCVIYFKVKCVECDCKGSSWGDIILGEGVIDHPVEGKAIIGDPNPKPGVGKKLECKGSYELQCNKPYNISAFYKCKDTACPSKVTYSLQPPTGLPITGTLPPLNFTPTVNGTYTLTLYGWCGDKICDSCVIKFKVKCVECTCKGSKWGELTITSDNQTKPLSCKKTYDWQCRKPFTINANYVCADPNCNGTVSYSLTTPSGVQTGNLPLTYNPAQAGLYTLVLYGMCGGIVCDSCVVYFKVECENCCPYQITVTPKEPTYVVTNSGNATTVTNNFVINGLATANITEVRAEVLSYVITDNFKNECMKCVNLPFTWASASSATSIGTVPSNITMYNGALVPNFAGTGTGVYQNPREVIWNNGTTFSIPANTSVGISFLLPPPPMIDCCELKARICVKFTFRNDLCQECEAIGCFDIVIKKK